MSETEITPQSVSADRELVADPDINTYRVLRRDNVNFDLWHEMPGLLVSRYIPTASVVGEAYGEGNYIMIEIDSKYSFRATYEMRVVAEKRFRLADEGA